METHRSVSNRETPQNTASGVSSRPPSHVSASQRTPSAVPSSAPIRASTSTSSQGSIVSSKAPSSVSTPQRTASAVSSGAPSRVSTPTRNPSVRPATSDHDAHSGSCKYQKRMFPDWRPLDYREWDLYPDQKERRHDGIWRGYPTTNEVTIERALGRSQNGGDTRNGIPLVYGGDKSYPSPEYSPDFFLTESHNPSHMLSLGRFRSKPQSIVPVPAKHPIDVFAEKRRRAQKLAETEEVRQLDNWEPSSSGPLYLT